LVYNLNLTPGRRGPREGERGGRIDGQFQLGNQEARGPDRRHRRLAIPGVKVVGVCNQRRESSARVAREFNIPKIYGTWENVVDDDEVDAVVIGSWPYLHCPVTLAAFDAGKHVLTEARMAMNSREAQRMYDRSREVPHLTAMIVPSPYGLTGEAFVRSLIASGYVGTLREVHVDGLTSDLADPATPLGWRQMTKFSGFNMLTLGILYETVSRWVPQANRVMAYA
jgi:predicted dehydrogenase